MRLRFAGVEVDTDTYELRSGGRLVEVEPQVFDVLVHLISHRDRVVTKEELLDQVWGDRFVSESALTTRIKQVRQAVGDDGREQRVIRTAHGRGYRFVAPVTECAEGAAPGARPGPRCRSRDAPPGPGHPLRRQRRGRHRLPGVRVGPDLVLIEGFTTNVEVQWEHPDIARFLRRLGSFCRVAVLDKRGTGLSERPRPGRGARRWSSGPTTSAPSWTTAAWTGPPCSGPRRAGRCRSCWPPPTPTGSSG